MGGRHPKTSMGTPPPPHLLGLPAAVEATLHVGVFFPVAVAVRVVGEEGVEGFAGGEEVVLPGFFGVKTRGLVTVTRAAQYSGSSNNLFIN